MPNRKNDIPVRAKDNPKEYYRLYRIANKERIKAYNASRPRQKQSRDRVRKRKWSLLQYRGGKCTKCGIICTEENQAIFDFHHEGEKEINLCPYTRDMETLKREADRCVVVCANCHRLIHWDDD